MTNVTLITGDGIGPEIAQAAQRCINATGAKINWEIREAGIEESPTELSAEIARLRQAQESEIKSCQSS